MSKLLEKLRDFVGFNEAEEYDYIEEEVAEEEPQYEELSQPLEPERSSRRRTREQSTFMVEETMNPNSRTGKVIGMPGVSSGASEVVVVAPHSFKEMPQVIDILRERRSVVLNLNIMPQEEAQRAVDFIAGGTYAIDGNQERIGESIFLFTPSCVKINTLSGVISEENDTTEIAQTTTTPTPIWAGETNRIAQ